MKKIWFSSYPIGVPEVIDADQFASIPEAIAHFCQTYSNQTAFSNLGSVITYQQLEKYSENLAAYFQQHLHLMKGDRVALLMPNILQFPVTLFAVLKAGLIAVNINPLYTAAEIKHHLQDSGAKVVVVFSNFSHTIATVAKDVLIEQVIVTEIGDLLGNIKGPLFSFVNKWIWRNVPRYKIKSVLDFKTALKKGAQLTFAPPVISPADIAFLQYTGGTTGDPKGAMLTHRNVLANIWQCVAWVKDKLNPNEEILLSALPLYHIFALTVSCFTFLALGGKCVLVTDPRNIRALVRIWRKHRPTTFIGLNTLFLHLLDNFSFRRLNFRSLKLTVSGGMATQTLIAKRWQELTGCVVTEGYGLTEASPVVSIDPANINYFNESAGLPVPSTDIKICDDQERELGVDEEGELWVKGPQVMLGYWRNPEATALVLDSQGWLKTGDIARVDARGFLFIVERKKDLIIVSGFNVYPSEVEAVIDNHPGVKNSAVVADKSQGVEQVKAVVVKKDPNLTAEDLRDYCREYLTAYKIPKTIEFRESLPKSNLGKILRRKILF